MKGKFEPLIFVFCCKYCPSCSIDLAKSAKLQHSHSMKIIKVSCIGAVGTIHILKALENGADGVCLMGCLEENCEYSNGSLLARKRVQYVKELLGKLSIEKERLEMYNLAAAEAHRFCELVRETTETVRTLGPIPFKIDNSVTVHC